MFLLNELYRELRKLVKAAKVGRKATKVFDRILSGRGLHTAKVCRPGFPSSRNNLHSVGVKVDGCPFVFPGVIEFGFNVPTGAMAKQLDEAHSRRRGPDMDTAIYVAGCITGDLLAIRKWRRLRQ